MLSTNEFKKGSKVEMDDEPYEIVSYEHIKPGKGQAFVRVKLKNLKTLNVVEKTFKSGVKIPKADVEEKPMQFLYQDEHGYHFMDNSNYEEYVIPKDVIEQEAKFLQENKDVFVLLYKNLPIGISLPNFVELKVIETEPGFKGDTAATGTKPAVLETNTTIQVPFFIKEGDILRIDTRTGEYVERVNK
ncbi:Translation elongation factor P [Desulfurella amilsii]|uniref:Elongation factor P n=1 Tax=Desulfurella amilsii TaxID=1562698 RepID=A0A1X4XVU3_9BACT|nr:elongation factor P [Desulfurella amilsii]OSS41666.1 Translation elongation factor P [Desulfurella amilsii]